jgi:hypothetical protein
VASIALLFGALFLLGGMFSCMEVDNTFGSEYIPGDHYMKIERDSSFQIKTYNVSAPDSVIASTLSLNLLGGYKNEKTGVSIDAGIVFQLEKPLAFHQNDSLYGSHPVIDSVKLQMYVADMMGPQDVEQTFDLYELNERIYLDSTYYFDYDPTPYMPAEPLASVVLKGKQSIDFRIEDPDFLRRLADTTGYSADSLFKKRFKSFYLKPRTAHADAAMYQVNLSYSSQLLSYYHNDEFPDTALRATYSMAPFMIEDSYNTPYNQTINIVDRDYSGVLPGIRLDEATTVSRTFVESYGGIQTKLEFSKESVAALKEKAREAGYKDVAINKALLQVYYPARDQQSRDELPSRLGMYYNFAKRTGTADYNWQAEYQTLLSGSTAALLYDGWIKPSRYLYQMDITYYVQRLMQEGFDKFEVYLGPSYETPVVGSANNWSNMYTAELAGYGSDTPLLLVLTYTLIK